MSPLPWSSRTSAAADAGEAGIGTDRPLRGSEGRGLASRLGPGISDTGRMEDVVVSPPRDLTPSERAILDFVINANLEHRDAVRTLLGDTKVGAVCGCGCGSPRLTTDESALDTVDVLPDVLPYEAVAKIGDSIVFARLHFGVDRRGASLEVDWYGPSDDQPTRLPRIDELEIARWKPRGSGRSLLNFGSEDESPDRLVARSDAEHPPTAS
jgi:hypothetical protein